MKPEFTRTWNWLFYGGLLLLLALSFQTSGVYTSRDSVTYLLSALNLLDGHGYTDYLTGDMITYRGPVFTMLISLAFSFFGADIYVAFLVAKIFFSFAIIMVVVSSHHWFGRKVSFTTAAVVLTHFALYRIGNLVLLDMTMASLMLLGLLSSIHALTKNDWRWSIIAGTILGVSYLLKEVAGTLFILPILYVIFFPKEVLKRRKPFARNISIFYVVLVSFLTSWYAFDYFLAGTGAWQHLRYYLANVFFASQLPASTGTLTSLKSVAIYETSNFLPSFLVNYYKWQLISTTFWAPLVPLSWGWVLLAAVVLQRRSAKYLFIGGAIYLPLVYYLGLQQLRWGQNAYMLLLSWMAIAYTLWSLLAFIPVKQVMRWFAGVCITAILVYGSVFLDQMPFYGMFQSVHFQGGEHYHRVYPPDFFRGNWQVTGQHGGAVQEFSEWALATATLGDAVVIDPLVDSRAHFYIHRQVELVPFPEIIVQDYDFAAVETLSPIALWTSGFESDSQAYLKVFDQQQFVDLINTNLIQQFALAPETAAILQPYFAAHPQIHVTQDTATLRAFRVELPLAPIETKLMVQAAALDYFDNLQRDNPQKFEHLVVETLLPNTDLTQTDLDAILNGTWPAQQVVK